MAMAREQATSPSAYEDDFQGWLLEQAALLRAGRFQALDIENIAEELEGLARSEARQLRSRYEILLLHLLKWEHQPDLRSRSRVITIRHQRHAILEHLAENRNLVRRRTELLGKVFPSARNRAWLETNLPDDEFPLDQPYTLDVMDPDFWPGPATPDPR